MARCRPREAWVTDLHLDGFRLDAIHAVYDDSARHVLAQFAARVHAARPGALVIAESGLNDPQVMRPPEARRLGHDAAWADDFHHALRMLLTGDRDGYYEEFGAVERPRQGVPAPARPRRPATRRSAGRRFGAPADDVPPERFVVFSQNHDQVGNRAFGDRLPREVRALAALCTLLSPFIPLALHGRGVRRAARRSSSSPTTSTRTSPRPRATGAGSEFAAFAAFAGEDVPDPQALETFERSKLTRAADPALAALYRATCSRCGASCRRATRRLDVDEEARGCA